MHIYQKNLFYFFLVWSQSLMAESSLQPDINFVSQFIKLTSVLWLGSRHYWYLNLLFDRCVLLGVILLLFCCCVLVLLCVSITIAPFVFFLQSLGCASSLGCATLLYSLSGWCGEHEFTCLYDGSLSCLLQWGQVALLCKVVWAGIHSPLELKVHRFGLLWLFKFPLETSCYSDGVSFTCDLRFSSCFYWVPSICSV